MALRVLVYRLLDGSFAICLETTDQQGAVIKRRWMGYRGDEQPHYLNAPPKNRIGPIRVSLAR